MAGAGRDLFASDQRKPLVVRVKVIGIDLSFWNALRLIFTLVLTGVPAVILAGIFCWVVIATFAPALLFLLH